MDQKKPHQKKPLDYLKIVFRRKWFIIIPVVIGTIGGIVAANVLPKVYRASTLILVEEGRIINPLVKDLAVSTSTAQRLAILREQILGWDRINQLINKLELAKDVKTQIQFEELVNALRKSIKVQFRGNDIVGIYYEGKDPEEAKNIVQSITDIFISENLRQQNKETDNAIAFINDQLNLYQKKVKQSEVAAMEEELSVLLVDSTDRHPMVIELRKKIEASKDEIERGDFTVKEDAIASSDQELKALKGELKELRDELATSSMDPTDAGVNRSRMASASNEKLYKLLLMEKVNQVTAQDVGVNKRLYNKLLERLETAKITQSLEASKEGTRYTILDPARLPLKPAKPKKILVLMMAMFMGACVGGGFVFGAEMLDRSFLGVDEAKAYLDLPVYGAISRIVTMKDMRTQKMRNARITVLSIIIGGALLIVILFNIVLSG